MSGLKTNAKTFVVNDNRICWQLGKTNTLVNNLNNNDYEKTFSIVFEWFI